MYPKVQPLQTKKYINNKKWFWQFIIQVKQPPSDNYYSTNLFDFNALSNYFYHLGSTSLHIDNFQVLHFRLKMPKSCSLGNLIISDISYWMGRFTIGSNTWSMSTIRKLPENQRSLRKLVVILKIRNCLIYFSVLLIFPTTFKFTTTSIVTTYKN